MPVSPRFCRKQPLANRTHAPPGGVARRGEAGRPPAERLDRGRSAGAPRLLGPPAALPDAPLGGRRGLHRALRRQRDQRRHAPLLELVPAERAAQAALAAAEEVDALLLELPDAVIAAALARPDAPRLDRGSHRAHHLDVIDAALAAAD